MTVYRTAGAWGAGKGADLTPAEVDENFYDHEGRIATLEGVGAAAEIENVTIIGSQLTFFRSDGEEFIVSLNLPTSPDVVTVTGTTKTLVLADANTYNRCTNASGCVVTIPTNAAQTFPVGTELQFRQAAAGAVSFVPDTGVTINGVTGFDNESAVQGAVVTIKKVATDTWDIFGQLLVTP